MRPWLCARPALRLFGAASIAVTIAALSACSSSGNTGMSTSGGAPQTGGSSGAPSSGGQMSSGGATSGGAMSGGSTSGGSTSGGSMNTSGGAAPSLGGSAGAPAGGGGSGGRSSSGGMSAGGRAGAGGTTAGGATNQGGNAGAAVGGNGQGGSAGGADGDMHWVGTWACGPQTTEESNLPPSPGLANNTLRQAVHVSIGGQKLRLRISNAYGTSAVTLKSVHIAPYKGSGAIDTAGDKAVSFGGMEGITIAAGKEVASDTFDYDLAPLSNVAITIAFGTQSGDVTGHPGSRTTSYLATGSQVSAASLTSPATTEHWYFITGIDVMAPAASKAIAILGDSITDGRGSTTNANDRWPDQLAKRLQANSATANVAVLNLGIGGNAVVSGGLGPTAVKRFDSDILAQPGVRWVIVFEGTNDIGSGGAQASSITSAFQQFIDKAHQKNLLIYGATITPFGGNSYASGESARTQINDWVRAMGHFDAVIDFDMAVRDTSSNPPALQSAYDSGDHLHLSPAGYQKMADSIDLSLFTK